MSRRRLFTHCRNSDGRPHYAKGLCLKCYQQQWRDAKAALDSKPQRVFSVIAPKIPLDQPEPPVRFRLTPLDIFGQRGSAH